MKTISVSTLKAKLSAGLRAVKDGEQLVVMEHKRPVARLIPYQKEALILREPETAYEPKELTPLTEVDPLAALRDERGERW